MSLPDSKTNVSKIFKLRGRYSLNNFSDLIAIIEKDAKGMKINAKEAELDTAATIVLEYYNENRLKSLAEFEDVQDNKYQVKKRLLNKLLNSELKNLKKRKDLDFVQYIVEFINSIFAYHLSMFKFLKIFKKKPQHSFQNEILMEDTINSCYNMGVQAIPIILFLGFSWGIIATLQGSLELGRFGVGLYAINVVVFMFFKFMGLLLSLLILSARSGSSMIAKIGMMRVADEWNSLKIMGIDPDVYILRPKIIAFIVLMPFLSYIACLSGIFGAYLTMQYVHNVGGIFIIDILKTFISFDLFIFIMIKGPIFGFIIGMICAHEARSISLNSESIVAAITKGVVYSIFACILTDVFMNIILFYLGMA